MTNNYRPIGCDQHSILELLAMHQAPVIVRLVAADGRPGQIEGRAVDVRTREHAEYLIVRDDGGAEHAVRLDHLLVLLRGDGTVVWRQENV